MIEIGAVALTIAVFLFLERIGRGLPDKMLADMLAESDDLRASPPTFSRRALWMWFFLPGLSVVFLSAQGIDRWFLITQALLSAWVVGAAAVDWRSSLLPDALTIPLVGAGLVAALLGFSPVTVAEAVMAIVVIGFSGHLMSRLTGFGGGDVWLMMGVGAWLGLLPALAVYWLACLLSLPFGMWMRRAGVTNPEVPMGPGIAVGTLVCQQPVAVREIQRLASMIGG